MSERDDRPDEQTQRLEPVMLAARAKAADAEAREAEDLKETPPAPAVVEQAIEAELRARESADPPPAREEEEEEEAPPPAREEEETPPTPPPPPAEPTTSTSGNAALEWARRHADRLIGGGIATFYFVYLLATARSLGFSRDEGFYFQASYEYQRWFKILLASPGKAFERSAIDPIWAVNHEHPSLMKSLFGLSHLYFWDRWKIIQDQSTALRLPGMVAMGVALYVTYRFASRVYSRRAGIAAALALGLMPRLFYHGHLACFDVPIMAMWITCIYTYWCAEKNGGLGWALVAGVVYGLTLETKHNAWILPAVFVPHVLVTHGRAIFSDAKKNARLPIPTSLLAMATVGPAVFVGLWPWLWNDTLPRLQEYVNFHVHHEYYNIEFLGVTYFGPPSPKSYMPVMILATVPTVTLVLFLVGAIDRLRALAARVLAAVRKLSPALPADPLYTDVLFFLALAAPLGPFLLPKTPIFGGTKHWITAYPFLAILAGRGFDIAFDRLEEVLRARTTLDEHRRRWALAIAGALTFAGPLAITRHAHPFGLSSYVPFFGGTAGGADLGLNRQFWGFTTQSLGEWFAQHTKPNDTVYIMDTSWPAWQRMVDEKRVPPWLRGVGSPAEAELALVHHEQHINEIDYNIWTEYGSTAPEFVLTHDGVPIISVYRRPPRRR